MNVELSVLIWAAVAVFALILADRQVTRLWAPRADVITDEKLQKRLAELEAMAKRALSASSSASLAAGVRPDERETRKGR